jgi:uncharacterized protein (DUF488 family)
MNDGPCLFTVGHSNQTQDSFVALLVTHGVQVLVDVRSHPYSRYVTHFNREELQSAVQRQGIRYGFFGRELGGRPDDESFYDERGHVLYFRVAQNSAFLDAIGRLEAGIREQRVAIMCSEEDPAVCHRHLLVGRVMAQRGTTILHIRGDGTLQTDAEIGPSEIQPSLFEIAAEDTWKSLRSVLPKRQPRSSSDSSGETESSDLSMSD